MCNKGEHLLVIRISVLSKCTVQKKLQHVSIIIQIIIREFVRSSLKSPNLKFNCQRLNVVMRQHNVRYVTHLYQTLCCRITTFNRWQLNFKFGDFKEESTNSLMMIWMVIEIFWSVLNVLILTFKTNIVEYMCISWYIRFSELKCMVKQLTHSMPAI